MTLKLESLDFALMVRSRAMVSKPQGRYFGAVIFLFSENSKKRVKVLSYPIQE